MFPMLLFRSFMVSCLLLTRNPSLFVPANHFSCFLLFCVGVKGGGEGVHVCVDVCMRRWMRCDGKKTTTKKSHNNNDRCTQTYTGRTERERVPFTLVLPQVFLCFLIGFVIKPIAMVDVVRRTRRGNNEGTRSPFRSVDGWNSTRLSRPTGCCSKKERKRKKWKWWPKRGGKKGKRRQWGSLLLLLPFSLPFSHSLVFLSLLRVHSIGS